MPLRNGHKALTAAKIDKAIRRNLPSYIKLNDGALNMDGKIYQTTFGCPWVMGEKWISVHMDEVRPELLDEWAETIAQQIVFTTATHRAEPDNEMVDAARYITDYFRRRHPDARIAGTTGTHYPVPQSRGSLPADSSRRDLRDTVTGLHLGGPMQGDNG